MTTRRLVLIRHAKAAAGAPDHDRPLAARGIVDAVAIGAWLVAADVAPDYVVVSTALRAQQTWEGAAGVLESRPVVVADERIYGNTADDLLASIHDAPADAGTVVLVGHNPSMAELASALDDGAGDTAARTALARSYPTSGVACFDVAAEWAELRPGAGTLTRFAAPRG
jgi:phosphohistidine phosphatase